MSGFIDFLFSNDFLTVAIGITIGVSFTTMVTTLVSSFITPLVSILFGGVDFSKLHFTFRKNKFTYGLFIDSVIAFLLICCIIYFAVVVPYNKLHDRIYGQPRKCPECTEKIPSEAKKCKFCGSSV